MSTSRSSISQANLNLINSQINQELAASYIYMSFYSYFGKTDTVYKGYQDFFKKSSEEEREHAMMFIDYVNMRGGVVNLKPIEIPDIDYRKITVLDAFKTALELEEIITSRLLEIHSHAESTQDVNLCNFLEEKFLDEQYKSIKIISDIVTNIQRCTTDFELMMLDNNMVKK